MHLTTDNLPSALQPFKQQQKRMDRFETDGVCSCCSVDGILTAEAVGSCLCAHLMLADVRHIVYCYWRGVACILGQYPWRRRIKQERTNKTTKGVIVIVECRL